MNGISVMLLLTQIYRVQGDWYGGPGVAGPVLNWGNTFYSSWNVTYANPGIISLMAIGWQYGSGGWVRRLIDNNPGPNAHYQGFSAFDIDGDGDKDLLLHSGRIARWYEFVDNWVFVKHDIYTFPAMSDRSGVWADDFDGDGDGDVVVATGNGGLYYCRNDGGGLAWTVGQISIGSRCRALSGDMDSDGDKDIVALQFNPGAVYLYRNQGPGIFAEELVYSSADDIWRLAIGDLDKDGDLDMVTSGTPGDNWVHTYINNGSGFFTHYAVYNLGGKADGMWLNDLNGDGILDITIGMEALAWNFRGLINTGDGINFIHYNLTAGSAGYTDGSIARDMDLDGMPDIVGSHDFIGYFRQEPPPQPWPTFTEYFIDNFAQSHWVYPDDLDQISCTPDVDILATRRGEHVIFENRMAFQYPPLGELVSSVLQLYPDPDSGGCISYFGWSAETCIPNDTSVLLYWRYGNTMEGCTTMTWLGPIQLPKSVNDSTLISTPCIKYFQYKLAFRPDTEKVEISTIGEVWVKYSVCPLYEKAEEGPTPGPSRLALRQEGRFLVLELPTPRKAYIAIYEPAGRLVSVLLNDNAEPGSLRFPITQFKPGVYFALYRDERFTERTTLIVR
ncbi:MAG: VCBS repeat-containing protein [candidate division WOR-3 bacterium]